MSDRPPSENTINHTAKTHPEVTPPAHPETHRFHQLAANQLGRLVGEKTRQFNEEHAQLTDKLYDPRYSLYAFLRDTTHAKGVNTSLDPTDHSWDIAEYGRESTVIYVKEAENMGLPNDLLDRPLAAIPKQFFHNVFRHLNQAMGNRQDHDSRLTAINDITALIATVIPEGFTEETKPKAHKKETQEEWVFRRALGLLQDTQRTASERKKPLFAKSLARNAKTIQRNNLSKLDCAHDALATPGVPDAIKAEASDFAVDEVASTVLEFIASDRCTPEKMREQKDDILRLTQMDEEIEAIRKLETETEIRVRDLHWEILPATELGLQAKKRKEPGSKDPSAPSINVDVEQELRDWLQLFNNGRGDIWRTKLGDNLDNNTDGSKQRRRTGKAVFWAAVWDEVISGKTHTHAIAINGRKGHASRRIVRGDDPNAQPWHQALRGRLQGEAERGVHRIHHGKYGEDRVVEIMTRPVNELGQKDYNL